MDLWYYNSSDRVAETCEACDLGELLRGLSFFICKRRYKVDKPFLSYDQQVEKLISKGMDIPDKDKAILILKENSYFAIVSGYKKPFKKSDGTYKKGVSIDDLFLLYQFDKELRHIFLKKILIVERHIKSLLSYSFSQRFGELQESYLDATNFDYTTTDPDKKKSINKLITILTEKTTPPFDYAYLSHQYNKHKNIPLWVAIKSLTFGNISKFYSLSQPTVKTAISKEFQGIDEGDLERMLDVLSTIRNICAHDERLYDYRLKTKEIRDTEKHKKLGIGKDKSGKYVQGKNDVYAVLIALSYLIDKLEFNELCLSIKEFLQALQRQSKFLREDMMLKQMGFPKNWIDILNI